MSSVLKNLALLASEMGTQRGLMVEELVIGLRYAIAVVRGSRGRAAGLCFIDVLDVYGDPPIPSDMLDLEYLPELAKSPYHMWRCAAVAISNAVCQYLLWLEGGSSRYAINDCVKRGCLLNLVGDARRVLVVGNMGPIVKGLRERGIEAVVVERSPLMRYTALTDTALPFVIHNVDAAIVTGATIPNGTIDHVLAQLRGLNKIIVVGPTAQLDPGILFERGVSYVASSRVIDISAALSIVKRGGGRHDLSEALRDYIAASFSALSNPS